MMEEKNSRYKIKESASQQLKNIFISESEKKLKRLKEILAEKGNNLEEQKKEIFALSHGYHGNAVYLGLDCLEDITLELDSAIQDNRPTETVKELTETLVSILTRIINQNKPAVNS
ncbi:MAG: Hpt domain-containing protein [bacterium]|nr:Hpt domain-containing protein [bacterium]